MNAFNNMMDKQTKQAEAREKLIKKAQEKQRLQAEEKARMATMPVRTEEEANKAMEELLAMEDKNDVPSTSTKKKKKKKKKA